MIRIGTAGWSYPSGAGKWTGIFYPEKRSVDHLAFYSRYFNTVEVNNTFYRPPSAATTRVWAEKTSKDFLFAVKLYQKFTHPKMFEEATGDQPRLSGADFDQFEAGIEPLAEAGKLGPLLAQFPPSFKRDDVSMEHLQVLLERFSPYQLVVELRHRSWTEDDSVVRLLEANEAGWVRIDEPRFKTSIRHIPNVGPVGYFRFHGRNFKTWWKGDRETRYDYLYSAQKQATLAQQITEVASAARNTHVVYNNHYGAKALANGLQMRLLLGQTIDAEIPQTLLDAYPDLAKLVEAEETEQAEPRKKLRKAS